MGLGGPTSANQKGSAMPSYALNQAAVDRARTLIDARQYVLKSDWGAVQPGADQENRFLRTHSWHEYGAWHLGLTAGTGEETKTRYAWVGRPSSR
jgi:hypothetical protein